MLSAYLVSFSVLLITSTVMALQGMENWLLYHFIGLCELVFSFILYRNLGLSKRWSIVFLFVLIAYILDSASIIVESYKATDEAKYGLHSNSLGLGLSSLFALSVGVAYLYSLFKRGGTFNILKYPLFYFNAGWMLYAAASFLGFFSISNSLREDASENMFYFIWSFISFFLLVKGLAIIATLSIRNEDG